jgi:pimeloyl-ACP methyl ester carboxylesterase
VADSNSRRDLDMSTVSANDVQLYYEDSGSGEPLVLVHGSWDDHTDWAAVAPALAESFRVVTYDRRGHSRSERPASQGSRRQDEDDLAALIETLALAPAHLVGNSFGAAIALGLATRRPDLVRSVSGHEPPLTSVVATHPIAGPMVQEVAATFQSVAGKLERGDTEGGTRLFMEKVALGPGAWAQLPTETREAFMHNAPTFADELADLEGVDIDLARVGRLEPPLQLTRGTESPRWFSAIADALARVAPDAEVHTFREAGHVPHVTHPDQYLDVVTGFIDPFHAPRENVEIVHAGGGAASR